MYKVLSSIGVTFKEMAKLYSYQLREVDQVWYFQWKDNRPVESDPIEWKNLYMLF